MISRWIQQRRGRVRGGGRYRHRAEVQWVSPGGSRQTGRRRSVVYTVPEQEQEQEQEQESCVEVRMGSPRRPGHIFRHSRRRIVTGTVNKQEQEQVTPTTLSISFQVQVRIQLQVRSQWQV